MVSVFTTPVGFPSCVVKVALITDWQQLIVFSYVVWWYAPLLRDQNFVAPRLADQLKHKADHVVILLLVFFKKNTQITTSAWDHE